MPRATRRATSRKTSSVHDWDLNAMLRQEDELPPIVIPTKQAGSLFSPAKEILRSYEDFMGPRGYLRPSRASPYCPVAGITCFHVSATTQTRAILFINALVQACRQRKYSLRFDSGSGWLYLDAFTHVWQIRLCEVTSADPARPKFWYRDFPTGLLHLKIADEKGWPIRANFKDDDEGTLESKLPKLMLHVLHAADRRRHAAIQEEKIRAFAVAAALAETERKKAEAAEHAKREAVESEARDIWQAEERTYLQSQAESESADRALEEEAERWGRAVRLRQYLFHLRQSCAADTIPASLAEFLVRGDELANKLDPSSARLQTPR